MSTSSAIESFLDLLRKSNLLEEKQFSSFAEKLRADPNAPSETAKLVAMLIKEGLITKFQGEHLLNGRWKGFFLGKYKILNKLGTGGMGLVYLAEHKHLRRRVALKVLPRSRINDSSSLERFYREGKAVAALDHPNIVRAYDIDQEGDLHFLVMEYVEGINLQDLIRDRGPLEPGRAAYYIMQAALGLQHAFSTGLIHRDIKPGNLLVDKTGVVKMLDLGLARFFKENDDLTRRMEENVLGTADYLAPEQAVDSHGVDIRADIYSLGGTFYYLLTGRSPFGEGTVAQKLIWHQTRQPKPISEYRQDVPDGLLKVIEKMMAKDPDERPQTPEEAAKLLEPFALGGEVSGSISTVVPLPPSLGTNLNASSSGETLSPSQNSVKTPNSRQEALASDPPRKTGSVRVVKKDRDREKSRDNENIIRPPSSKKIRKPLSSKHFKPLTQQKLWLWIALAAGLALFTITLLIVIVVLASRTTGPHPPGKGQHLYVIKSPKPNATDEFASLSEALKKAAPGDHITIRDKEVYEEQIVIDADKSYITIEGVEDAGKTPTLVLPAKAAPTDPIILLNGANSITLKKITLDGVGKTDLGLSVTGKCPNLLVEDVHFQGFRQIGLQIRDLHGGEKPATFKSLKFESKGAPVARSAIQFMPPVALGSPANNIQISGCFVDTKYEAGVRFQGPVNQLTIDFCTFYSTKHGIVIEGPPKGIFQMAFLNNSFLEFSDHPLLIQPALGTEDSSIELTNNLFKSTVANPPKDLLQSGEKKPEFLGTILKGAKNFHEKNIPPGIIKDVTDWQKKNKSEAQIEFVSQDVPIDVNRSSDKFLQYPKKNPLANAGKNGVHVGARQPHP
jgi:serine/threonine protein kinase